MRWLLLARDVTGFEIRELEQMTWAQLRAWIDAGGEHNKQKRAEIEKLLDLL